MEPSFDSLDQVLAYLNRRKEEGARVVMTAAARAYFQSVATEGSTFFVRVLVSDDGEQVTVDLPGEKS